jgi:protein O-mannosyl-transferase
MAQKAKKNRLRDARTGNDEGKAISSFVIRHSPFVPAVCGLLLLAVITVFGQTAGHDFVNFDDDDYVLGNWHVREGLTGRGLLWAITEYHSCNWHPLTWLSHMLDCRLYETKPGGHHLTNVVLHAATAILLFLALWRMTAATWRSAWVAAVFAVHPLRVESVAWVAERKDVLSGLCCMLTLWLYAGYVQRPQSWARYLLVVASFAVGLSAKPMLVTLPFVLLLLDFWPLRRVGPPSACTTSLARLVLEKVPFLVLSAAACTITLATQAKAMHAAAQATFPTRIGNAVVAYVVYLGKMFYPTGLAVLYPLSIRPVQEWAADFLVLFAISAIAFLARRQCPYLLVGWLWYLGTLVPVIGLVQVGDQALADRYTYLTQIGLYAALAWGAADMAGTWPLRRLVVAALSVLLLVGLMVGAWQQTRYWRNSETLWTRTLECTPPNAIAHQNMGNYLAGQGKNVEAITEYREALKIKPDYAPAHENLGVALAAVGQVEKAIVEYHEALDIEPRFVAAYVNLGIALAGQGKLDEAIFQYRKALEINPDDAEAHFNFGRALARQRKIDDAIGHYLKVIEVNPDDARAQNNLGTALGRSDAAIARFRRALEIDPRFVIAHVNLGIALAGNGQVTEAIAHFQKALEIQPGCAEAQRWLDSLRAKSDR